MVLSSGYSLIIKSVEIIFRSYYFIKLFGSINSRKNILQNHIYIYIYIYFFFFLVCDKGNLLCCTKKKKKGD